MRGLVIIASTLALAACGRSREQELPPPTATITLMVDGMAVAAIDARRLVTRPTLAELLPEDARDPAGWTWVEASTGDGRELSLAAPAIRRPDQQLVVYLDGDRPAIGAFRAAPVEATAGLAAELARPRVALIDVATIHIHVHSTPAPVEPTAGFAVSIDGRDRTIDLAAIKRTPAARGDAHAGGGDQRQRARGGWPLEAVVAAATGGAPVTRVRVLGDPEQSLDAAELATGWVLRRNRRGALAVDRQHGSRRERGPREVRGLAIETAAAPHP